MTSEQTPQYLSTVFQQFMVEEKTGKFSEMVKVTGLSLATDFVGVDLSGEDLSNDNLSGANLSNANLSNANLSNVNLSNANLSNANLSDANLRGTNLSNANLSNANLLGANLLLANLTPGTQLNGANLSYEYVSNAYMYVVHLSYANNPLFRNLSNVRQLVSSTSNVNQKSDNLLVASLEDGKMSSNQANIEVEKFRVVLGEEVKDLESVESNNKIEKYFEKFKLIFKFRQELEDIENSLIACKEASEWLSNKREELVLEARNYIINDESELENFKKVAPSPEQVELFCRDIDIYLIWLGLSMSFGRKPTPLPQGIITLALPGNTYAKALKFIKNKRVSTDKGLSNEAVTELRGYLTRFLITPLSQLDSREV